MVSATCKYSSVCRPLGYSKCPLRRPPVWRSNSTTSAWVGTRCMSVRSSAAQHLRNGPQHDLPVESQRPRVDILHVHSHPGVKVDLIAAADHPQAGEPGTHPQAAALPSLILFHF